MITAHCKKVLGVSALRSVIILKPAKMNSSLTNGEIKVWRMIPATKWMTVAFYLRSTGVPNLRLNSSAISATTAVSSAFQLW